MSISETDHIVIVVEDIDEGIRNWRDRFGLPLSHTVDHVEVGIRQAFFSLRDGSFIELVAPTHDDSPIAGVLSARGEGVHVVALKVDDLDATTQTLQERGVKLIGVGTPQVFVHPKSANGVLIQLWPKDRPHRWRDSLGGTAEQQEARSRE